MNLTGAEQTLFDTKVIDFVFYFLMSNAQPTTECLLKNFHGNSIMRNSFCLKLLCDYRGENIQI